LLGVHLHGQLVLLEPELAAHPAVRPVDLEQIGVGVAFGPQLSAGLGEHGGSLGGRHLAAEPAPPTLVLGVGLEVRVDGEPGRDVGGVLDRHPGRDQAERFAVGVGQRRRGRACVLELDHQARQHCPDHPPDEGRCLRGGGILLVGVHVVWLGPAER
jgi:hypothetical protein